VIRATIFALVIAAACMPASTAPSPTPSPGTSDIASPVGSASPGRTAPPATTGRFGMAYPNGSYLRLESDAEPFGYVDGSVAGVAPDGWSLAYWQRVIGGPDTNAELRVVDLRTGAERPLLSSKDERAGQVLWRSDGTALAVTAIATSIASGGADPPPAFVRLYVVDLATGTVREMPRIVRSRFTPLAWSARTHVITGASLGEGGLAAVIRLRDDGTRLPDITPSQRYDNLIGSPDGESLVATYRYGEGNRFLSGAHAFSADTFTLTSKKDLLDDPALVDIRYRGDRGDLLALLRLDTRPINTFALEIWPRDLAAAGRRVWSSQAKSNTYEGPIVRLDGAAAYLDFFELGTTVNGWIRVDLISGADAPFPANTRGVPSAMSFLISDAAIDKLRIRFQSPSISRDDAIARVRARGNVVRADRTEAKLMPYREVAEYSPDLTPNKLPRDAPVWAVAIGGDIVTVDGTKLLWGVWYVDGRNGDVIGFVTDPIPARSAWPWFWDTLPDRR
jgi:hypothetical protein